jgi:cytosine/adenosine deaminase-related metal-dependent hydrolase
MQALGWDAGELKPGMLGDFITLDQSRHTRSRQLDPAFLVYGHSACDVINVVVGGKTVVSRGRARAGRM